MPETTTPSPVARVTLAEVSPAIALGPLDGRYRKAVAPLVDHLSEAALNRERIHVEVEWLITLCNGAAGVEAPVESAGLAAGAVVSGTCSILPRARPRAASSSTGAAGATDRAP